MVDQNIKKVRILKKDLPDYVGNNDELFYQIRYRIVSEDKNRFSHWSPIHKLELTSTFDEVDFDIEDIAGTSIPHNVYIDDSNHTAAITWTMPSLLIPDPNSEQRLIQAYEGSIKGFDVYVQWKTSGSYGGWIWVGSANRKYEMKYPSTGPTHIKFRVQKVTKIKQAFDAATYLISTEQAL